MLSITLASRSNLGAGVTFLLELRRGIGAGVRIRDEYLNPDDPGPTTRVCSPPPTPWISCSSRRISRRATVRLAANAGTPVIDFLRNVIRPALSHDLDQFRQPLSVSAGAGSRDVIVAWGASPMSQRAAAQALVGINPISGRLPISIPPSLKFGGGEMRPAAQPASQVSRP